MRKCFSLFFLSFFYQFIAAQNSPVLSHFMFFKQQANPASVGSEDALDVAAVYRAQWVGINGNPTVQALSVQSPLNVLNSSVGLFIINEMQGEERYTSAMLSYAYRHSFKKISLAGGVSAGIFQRAIDGSKLRSPEGNYEAGRIDHEDDFIPDKLTSAIAADLNVGIYLSTRKLYAGISANNVLESNVKLQGQGVQTEVENPRYYTAVAGYRIKVGKKLNLIPNVSLRTDFINTQAEINTILQYKDNIYGGMSFRGFAPDLKDAVVLMAGFKIFKNFRVGYSYDIALSSLNEVNSGSHEVYLRYAINIKELVNPGKIIYNPRNL